jgi:hypothetical protein
MRTTNKPADQDPQRGGSYVRQEDGSLDLVDATKPAKLQVATEPSAAAAVQDAPVAERDDITGQE